MNREINLHTESIQIQSPQPTPSYREYAHLNSQNQQEKYSIYKYISYQETKSPSDQENGEKKLQKQQSELQIIDQQQLLDTQSPEKQNLIDLVNNALEQSFSLNTQYSSNQTTEKQIKTPNNEQIQAANQIHSNKDIQPKCKLDVINNNNPTQYQFNNSDDKIAQIYSQKPSIQVKEQALQVYQTDSQKNSQIFSENSLNQQENLSSQASEPVTYNYNYKEQFMKDQMNDQQLLQSQEQYQIAEQDQINCNISQEYEYCKEDWAHQKHNNAQQYKFQINSLSEKNKTQINTFAFKIQTDLSVEPAQGDILQIPSSLSLEESGDKNGKKEERQKWDSDQISPIKKQKLRENQQMAQNLCEKQGKQYDNYFTMKNDKQVVYNIYSVNNNQNHCSEVINNSPNLGHITTVGDEIGHDISLSEQRGRPDVKTSLIKENFDFKIPSMLEPETRDISLKSRQEGLNAVGEKSNISQKNRFMSYSPENNRNAPKEIEKPLGQQIKGLNSEEKKKDNYQINLIQPTYSARRKTSSGNISSMHYQQLQQNSQESQSSTFQQQSSTFSKLQQQQGQGTSVKKYLSKNLKTSFFNSQATSSKVGNEKQSTQGHKYNLTIDIFRNGNKNKQENSTSVKSSQKNKQYTPNTQCNKKVQQEVSAKVAKTTTINIQKYLQQNNQFKKSSQSLDRGAFAKQKNVQSTSQISDNNYARSLEKVGGISKQIINSSTIKIDLTGNRQEKTQNKNKNNQIVTKLTQSIPTNVNLSFIDNQKQKSQEFIQSAKAIKSKQNENNQTKNSFIEQTSQSAQNYRKQGDKNNSNYKMFFPQCTSSFVEKQKKYYK